MKDDKENAACQTERGNVPVKPPSFIICTELPPSSFVPDQSFSWTVSQAQVRAVQVGQMWSAGTIIRVSFDRGIMPQNDFEQVVSQVQRYARVWSRYANIFSNFIDGPFEDGQIRITFESGPGHYSYVGDMGFKSSQPTMNFDSREINVNTPLDRFQRVVLHEFGHALGCIHEYSQPKSPIKWNKVKLYDHYLKYFNWDKAMVDLNIIKRYEVWSKDDTDLILQYAL
ncbi:hypothetical protein QCA50_004810 [Cerrena zonata]|uniref:Peptidase metallopeptidase domain-containing protein n=1 Tax=Cerrena zonata TaxID=2478898 RepID=A0AAW0GPH9_9APHY